MRDYLKKAITWKISISSAMRSLKFSKEILAT